MGKGSNRNGIKSLREAQSIFALNVSKLISYAYKNGYELTLGEVWRTYNQQKAYYKVGATKTMKSQHLKKLAIDINPFIQGRLTYQWKDVKQLGDYWETLHPLNRWGGDWNKNDIKDGWLDAPHFEMNY